jgi:hypothetical protein
MLAAWSEAETGVGKVALISLFYGWIWWTMVGCVGALFFPVQGIECLSKSSGPSWPDLSAWCVVSRQS